MHFPQKASIISLQEKRKQKKNQQQTQIFIWVNLKIFMGQKRSNLFPLLSSLLLLSLCSSHVESNQEGYISIDISNKGLNFIKDLLIEKAKTSLVPLELSQIEKTVNIPFLGSVDMVLSNITIYEIDVSSSTVKTGDSGVVIAVSGATASLTMQWEYSYSTWLIPIAVSDDGDASVQVAGMEVGLTISLKNQQGSLKLSLLECGCYVQDLSIKLNGGASWLYQGLVDAFDDKIASAVEDAVSKKIRDAIVELDSLLQSLPKEVPINDVAALNITFVSEPVLSNSSLGLQIDGLFTANDKIGLSKTWHEKFQALFSKAEDKMVSISVHEKVLESASLVYFEADKLHWTIDKVPDQLLLNTAGWRFIIPQLYKQYPNDDMKLDVSISLPPVIKIEKKQIDVSVPSDVIIEVLDADKVVPVACISIVISASATAEISSNSLTGSVKLNDFTMALKWSKVGSLHMFLVQSVMSTLLKTVVLPYVNLQLRRGIPLPAIHGYILQNADIIYSDSWIIVCGDVASGELNNLITRLFEGAVASKGALSTSKSYVS